MKIIEVPYINKTYSINKILKVKVDDDIYEKIKNNKIYVSSNSDGQIHYYFRIGGSGFYSPYGGISGGGKYTYLHRYVIDCPSGMVADHIDGDTLNNTRSNLRALPKHLNNANRKVYLNHGIVKQKNGKYRIKLHKNDMELTLSNVEGFEEALSIRLRFRELIHGI